MDEMTIYHVFRTYLDSDPESDELVDSFSNEAAANDCVTYYRNKKEAERYSYTVVSSPLLNKFVP